MKKNKMIRAASGVMILTMLSTCATANAYAKYTTADNGEDSARVAKWGVKVLVSGDLFGAHYLNEKLDNKISAEYTGSADSSKTAAGAENIVAPGTNSDKGVAIVISGTPEVENKVTFESDTSQNKDIYLKAGKYGTLVKAEKITQENFPDGEFYWYDSVTSQYVRQTEYLKNHAEGYYEVHDQVALENDYFPLKWTISGAGNNEYSTVNEMAGALKKEYNGTNQSLVTLDKFSYINWSWDFDDSGKGTNDGADTILGNIIAANSEAIPVKTTDEGEHYVTLTEDTDYCTDVAFNYSIAITQVD